MSDEEKVSTESTQASAVAETPKKKAHWPIVLGVIVVVVIAVLVGVLHLHEQPKFCSTICHATMQKYVDGYYSEDSSLSVAKHAQADVTCLGCHWSQAKMMDLVHEVILYVSDSFTDPLPDMRTEFVNDEFCGACHDGTTAKTKEEATSGWAIDPHNIPEGVSAHEGQDFSCSSCHSVHKTSTMVCATCHDGMVEVPEGWTTPEVSVNVLGNHSDAVSSDQCVTCHDGITAPTAESASADYTWNGESFDFHNMSDELKTVHEGFIEGFDCQTCHAEQSVAVCTTCHTDVFTEDNLPAGWTGADETTTDDADSSDTEAVASDATYTDGTYTASSKGIGGDVPVTVTVEGGKIASVEVGDNSETQGIGSKAIEQLPDEIVAANGTDGVDAVSGASVTSKAIFTAVNDCLEQAQA